jgi:uncharacterized membrane protein YphA (DoxX/SURF4 family)
MQAISLLLMRLSTGIYLILWGIRKLDTEGAAKLSNKYYDGMISGETVSLSLGGLEIITGLLVCLGLFRKIGYWSQVAWYFIGILPIYAYILDPFGLYLIEEARLTFFPSTTLLFASFVLIAFQKYDTLSLDHKRQK